MGPGRDGVYPDPSFTPVEPRPLWQQEVGQGFSAPSVSDGRVVIFHRVADRERVEALDALSARPIWSAEYETRYRDDFGFDEGPRATPVIADGKVFVFGAQGMLTALDFETGERLWAVDTRERFDNPKGWFGAASSPLFVDGKVLVNVGGPDEAGIVAFDASTGEVSWRATGDEASYSSPTFSDGRAFFLTRDGLVVVRPDSGEVVLRKRWRSRSRASVNAATPLVIGDVVFVSASYGTGAFAARMAGAELDVLWSSDDVLSGHYATAVHRDGVLYGYHGRQEYGPALRAVSLKTGDVHWSEDKFRAGTLTLAGDRLLVLRESGELVVARASEEAFEPLFRKQLLSGVVRSYPALASGKLYLRNESTLACFDLSPP